MARFCVFRPFSQVLKKPTPVSLRRGTAARSEGEAPQGDVDGVNEELAEEPHQPPSLALGHPCTVCDISTNIPRPR